MRVLLINPKLPVYLRVPSVPLGLISIGSYLRAHGDDVILLERSDRQPNIEEVIDSFQPQVIGISCMSYQSSIDAKHLTKRIHKICKAPVIWGGQAPSSLPEMYLRDGRPDYLSLGEGEITIFEFAHAVENGSDISQIKGLAYLDDSGNFIKTPDRPVSDLQTFPELDWTLVNPQKYFSSFFHCSKMLYLHASKGCPAACTFCSNKKYHQGRNRCRNLDHILHDLEYLVGKCGANGIYFSDELFLPDRRIRNEFLSMVMESNLEFVWGCQMRLGVLKEEDIDLMYKAGCRWILFGIESGSPQMIRKIKKGIDLSLAKPTIDYCEKIGITVQASFIIGFPDETPAEMQQTIDFALSLHASLPVLNILIPAPNSEVYSRLLEVEPDFRAQKSIRAISRLEAKMTDTACLNLSQIPEKELYVVHYYFQWKDFIGKTSVNNDSFGIVKKMAGDAFNRIFKHGLSGFVFGTYHSVRQFVTVWFFSHCFPKTLKKYGLK